MEKIEKITKDVCYKYLKNKNISKFPQKPNFNRDLLINILFEKFKNIPNINENEIIKRSRHHAICFRAGNWGHRTDRWKHYHARDEDHTD